MEVHWRNGQIIKTRKREHIENVKKCKVGSNIAKHAWENNHGNHGILLSPSMQITMPNIYQNSIDSY